jgi:proteasome accessory factor C
MTEPSRGRLGRRMRRILLMIPYIVQHPGVSLDELSSRFAVEQSTLVDDLRLIFFCGLPGYTPADLMDVSFEGGRVYVDTADYFATPLRLTPAEALSLYAGGAALVELPGMEQAEALRRALTKLGSALGQEGESNGPAGVAVRVEPGPAEHVAVLRGALAEGVRVSMEYYSAARGKLTTREVDPWGLVAALGRLYLVGLDHLSEEERMFRTDRIKSVTATEHRAEVPPDFDPERYRGAFSHRGGEDVVFEISPEAAEWFADYYPLKDQKVLDDGWRRVTLTSGGERWTATLLLRLGHHVRNVAPPTALERARELAAAIAAIY